MIRDPKKISISGVISLMLVIINALVLRTALVTGDDRWYLAFVFTIPLLLIAISNTNFRKNKKQRQCKK